MHVTDKMDQEFSKGFAGEGVTGIVVLKQFRGVLDTIEDVDAFLASPKTGPRKGTSGSRPENLYNVEPPTNASVFGASLPKWRQTLWPISHMALVQG